MPPESHSLSPELGDVPRKTCELVQVFDVSPAECPGMGLLSSVHVGMAMEARREKIGLIRERSFYIMGHVQTDLSPIGVSRSWSASRV